MIRYGPVVLLFLAALLFSGCSDRVPATPPGTPASAAATAAGSPSGTGTTASGAPPTAVSSPSDHDGDRAFAYLKVLADTIGPRVAGSPGEHAAAAYIASQFRINGYDVELMSFNYSGDRFQAGTIVVGSTTYEAQALDGSAAGVVSGDAVFVGLADAAGIANQAIGGKVAVADRGSLTFAEKYERVKAAGAVALIILNNVPGQLNGRSREGGTIPVLGISGEDAAIIRAAALAGQRFTVTAPANNHTAATNIIARPPAGAACSILVGAHYDTVPDAPGANDNASGVANLLEIARAAATTGPASGLCFAAWSAEESGLFGSSAFVEEAKSVNALPGLYINLDVTGIGTSIEIIGESEAAARALAIAGQQSVAARRIQLPPNTGSDHMSFEAAGVPVVYLSSGEFATIHSPQDVASDIDIAELDRIGDLALALIRERLPVVARGQGHS